MLLHKRKKGKWTLDTWVTTRKKISLLLCLLLRKVKLNILFFGRQTVGKSEENTALEVLKKQREQKSSHVPFYQRKKLRSVQ